MPSFFYNCLTINGFYFAPSPETEGRCFASKVNKSSLKQEKPQEGEQQGGEKKGGEKKGGEQQGGEQQEGKRKKRYYVTGVLSDIITGDDSDRLH